MYITHYKQLNLSTFVANVQCVLCGKGTNISTRLTGFSEKPMISVATVNRLQSEGPGTRIHCVAHIKQATGFEERRCGAS